MKRRVVSIKFCGGCNPRIDRGSLARDSRKGLGNLNIDVVFNSLDADFVIFLSGCDAGCAFRYSESDLPFIAVAGTSLDGVQMNEGEIIPVVIKKVRQFYGQLEKDLPEKNSNR